MSTARRILSGLTLGIVVASAVPVVMVAQQPAEPRARALPAVRTTATLRNARADTLEAFATVALRGRDGWREAARLQRRAAELRGDDVRAVESYERAAWLYGGAGLLGSARQMMERAAQRALMGGDVERAAGAYLDAALIAIEDDREDLVPGLVRRTRRLLESPVLPTERRDLLLRRIDGAPALAQHWRRANVN